MLFHIAVKLLLIDVILDNDELISKIVLVRFDMFAVREFIKDVFSAEMLLIIALFVDDIFPQTAVRLSLIFDTLFIKD